jgi:hypothetical protein
LNIAESTDARHAVGDSCALGQMSADRPACRRCRAERLGGDVDVIEPASA